MTECVDCGSGLVMHESKSYYARWQQCNNCGWKGTVEIIPVEERDDSD